MPVIAFYVEGLRDSILGGWLIAPVSDLADAIVRALPEVISPEDEVVSADRSLFWASMFTWRRSAERIARVALHEMERERRRQLPDQPTVTTIRTAAPQTLTGRPRAQLDATHQLAMGEGTVARVLDCRDDHRFAHLLARLGDAEFTSNRQRDRELLVGLRLANLQLFGGPPRV